MTSVPTIPTALPERAGSGDERRFCGSGVVMHAHGERGDAVLAALRSARNVRAEMANVPLEIVVQGGAVASVVTADGVYADALQAIAEVPVAVALCHNSLVGAGLDDSDVPTGLVVVPAAAAHLAQRQWQGWAYVRL